LPWHPALVIPGFSMRKRFLRRFFSKKRRLDD
jgi:hypothetical protein